MSGVEVATELALSATARYEGELGKFDFLDFLKLSE